MKKKYQNGFFLFGIVVLVIMVTQLLKYGADCNTQAIGSLRWLYCGLFFMFSILLLGISSLKAKPKATTNVWFRFGISINSACQGLH